MEQGLKAELEFKLVQERAERARMEQNAERTRIEMKAQMEKRDIKGVHILTSWSAGHLKSTYTWV